MEQRYENCADSFGRISNGKRCGLLSCCIAFTAIIVYIAVAIESVEPTEYFGRDFTQMGELIDMLAQLDLVKADTKLKKKMLTLDERNIDMVATASKLRKEYEVLYREIRDTIYPNKKGELRDE